MERRVALIPNAAFFVGPPLARLLAGRGHDLVLGGPDPALVADCEALGATVVATESVVDLRSPEPVAGLVAEGLDRFGRLDAAVAFSGRVVTGTFAEASAADLDAVVEGCLREPFHFLKAVVPPMVERGDGQILLLTSAAGLRPTSGAVLYSSVRAAANMLVRNVAAEVAPRGVQVNAVGTNFMDFPEFRRASGADDPEVRRRIESRVPLRRLGTVEECAAFCAAFCDGTSRFTTGQVVGYAGGWA